MAYYLLVYMTAASLTALALYGIDKRRAQRNTWRIPERVLLAVSILGGAPGSLCGMLLFRHKTNHWYFWSANSLAAVCWLAFTLKAFISSIN